MAREFRNDIFHLCKRFPPSEKFRLVDQMIRSSRSIAANIAEGSGRYHHKENIRFCRMARGSLEETLEHLICGVDIGLYKQADILELLNNHESLLKMINGYIRYLSSRI